MGKSKVLHILSSKTYNGAENVVCQINRMLRETETSFELIYCSLDGPVRRHIEDNNITFVPVKSISRRELKKVIQMVRPDIIHAHDMRAGFVSGLACGDIPLISHIHNNNFDSRRISLKSVLYLYAAIKAKRIFWVSESSFDGYCFHSLLKRKSEVLFNAIDIEELYQKARQDSNVYTYDAVYLGRLTFQKNPQRLIEVLSKAVKKKSTFTAAVLGDGEDVPEVLSLIKEKGIAENVEYLGYFNNPYKVLLSAKMMLMTSRWEGTPMCALEAIGMGIPIISTPVDGMCDLINNGINGFLSDDDDELAKYCVEIASNSILQKQLSNGAKETAQRQMNLDSYRDAILTAYNSVIK